jgi:hypothetical protein
MAHLFFRCNFAKAGWSSIGASVLTSRPVFQILKLLKDKLAFPFYMEIIILMTWATGRLEMLEFSAILILLFRTAKGSSCQNSPCCCIE